MEVEPSKESTCFCGQLHSSMCRSIVFLPIFICLHDRSASGMTFFEALKAVTGLRATRSSTHVMPYASSGRVLLDSWASEHPSSVKYHSSVKLNDFNLPIAN